MEVACIQLTSGYSPDSFGAALLLKFLFVRLIRTYGECVVSVCGLCFSRLLHSLC